MPPGSVEVGGHVPADRLNRCGHRKVLTEEVAFETVESGTSWVEGSGIAVPAGEVDRDVSQLLGEMERVVLLPDSALLERVTPELVRAWRDR